MPIVSSQIVADDPQIDGRRHVAERHTDHVGVQHFVRYIAAAADDVNAIMAARVAPLEAQLKASEASRNLANISSGNWTYTADWNTGAEMQAAVRAAYPKMNEMRVGWTAGFLNTLGDAALQNMFGITQPEVAALRSRLSARYAELQAVLTAVGE